MEKPSGKPTVMVVDDTLANRLLLLDVLEDEYEVVPVADGEEALGMINGRFIPDTILLDVVMPGLDGYEVCRLLKSNLHTKNIPVIFVTSLDDEEEEARGLALGAADYIIKPFRPSLIKARVRNTVNLRKHQDHLEELVAERTKKVLLTQEVTFLSLASLAEHHDPDARGHLRRTQYFVLALVQDMIDRLPNNGGLLAGDTHLLSRSSALHDIGKVGIPDNILMKPGKLTPKEFEKMKQHTLIGYDALQITDGQFGEDSFLTYAREIIRHHHEKWDGTGYPDGLAGEDIPLPARIMAVADVYDALISKRSYKEPFSHEEAISIIQSERGKHFDPRLVDSFLRLENTFRKVATRYAAQEEERSRMMVQEE